METAEAKAAAVGEAVLDAVCARVRREGALSDESLHQLHFLFDKTLVSAVDLLDHATITRVAPRGATARAFWRVQSTSGHVYHCFSGYCTCQAFAFLLAHGSHGLLSHCKHQLAARLADALGSCTAHQIDDERWGVELLGGCGEDPA